MDTSEEHQFIDLIFDIIENLTNGTTTINIETVLGLRLYLSGEKSTILRQSLKNWRETGFVNYDLLNHIDKCDSILRFAHHEKE